MSTEPAAVTETPAPKAVKAKPATKKAPAKATINGKSATKRSDKTTRLRIFEALAKAPDGLTAAQLRKKLATTSVCALLKAECLRTGRPRLKRMVPLEDAKVKGNRFALTAAGKAALTAGTVDSGANDPEVVYGKGSPDWD